MARELTWTRSAAMALCLAGFLCGPTRARAWCQMTTQASAPTPGSSCSECGPEDTGCFPLQWQRRCVAYSLHENGSADMALEDIRQVFQASFGSWLGVHCDGETTDFDVRETRELSLSTEAEFHNDGGNVNTIAFIEHWLDLGYDPRAFALTTVWHDTRSGEILDVDMQLNERQGPFDICPSDGCPEGPDGEAEAVDLQNVATHEIGHFFGLGHTDSMIATMAPTSVRGETGKRVLRTDDSEGFCSIYPPGSLPGRCDYTPIGGFNPESRGGGGGGCNCDVGASGTAAGTGWAATAIVLLAAGLRRRLASVRC